MTVYIEKETDASFFEEYEDIIRTVAEASADYVDCPYETQVEVTLVDNVRIHEMNRSFREVDRPTDVLSFPMVDYETAGDFSLCEAHPESYFGGGGGQLLLGDIVTSVEKVYEQAVSYGHSPKRELAFLVAHSMLHLFGYDHMEEEERVKMEQMQEEILTSLGFTRDI